MKKTTRAIHKADATGRCRANQAEVRKRRTFFKRADGFDLPAEEVQPEVAVAPSTPVIDDSELLRREEEANRHAELLRRQEAELTEKRRLREEQDAKDTAREQERLAAEEAAQVAVRAAEVAKKAKPASGKAKEKEAAPVTAEASQAAEAAATEQASKAADAAAAVALTKAKATAEFQADAAKVQDLQDRRRKAEAEAAGIRAMLSAPKRVLVPHVDPKVAMKGTLHKPAVVPGAAKPGAPVAAAVAGAAGEKEVKSENLY